MQLSKNFSNFLKAAVTVLFSMAVLTSCNKDDLEKGGATIIFKAPYPDSGISAARLTKSVSSVNSGELSNGVVIESFKINIKEIELEFDDDHPLFATGSMASDIELEGPFEIDLMLGGNALVNVIAENVELPAAAYKEIEFEFDASENSISEMFMKTILVKGTIYGTPFIFWQDDSFDVEIEFDYNVHLDEAKQAIIIVSFDIASLFDPAKGGIDISHAKDGNGNGIIEIYPDDPDGNDDLAGKMMDRLEDIIDAFEEMYDN
jgi:hypothetical protein